MPQYYPLSFSLRTPALVPSALLLAAALFSSTSARADVRYTTQMSMGGANANGAPPADMPAGMPANGMPLMRTTTYVKDMHERVETSVDIGPMHMNTVTLTLCDKHQTVKLDPALKIYTVSDIGSMTFTPPSRPGRGGMGGSMPEGKPGIGHIIMTFNVQDLGTEKVADIDARHYKMTIRSQTSGCIGTADTTIMLENWVAPIKGALNCPERFSPARSYTNGNGCQITTEMKGDFSAMRDAYAGMPVRTKFYQGDKLFMTTDMRDYSTAALDDALFTTPDDYKQVSDAEFSKAESDAMMKNMMGGMGSMFTPPTPETSAPPADNGAGAAPTPDATGGTDNTGGTQTPPPASPPKKKKGIFGLPSMPKLPF